MLCCIVHSAQARSCPSKQPNLEDVLREISDSCTPEETAEAWSKTANIIKTYSDGMIGKWNSEIDTLLVYVRSLLNLLRPS